MRAELPWNVAGIPPEAREAARAAARREGLSVGEWLTRRIISELGPDAAIPGATGETGIELPSAPDPRDTEEMLARLAKAEIEASDSYRRIEEHLRELVGELDNAERSQSESNRAMSWAASEIGLASHERSQAFDQLGRQIVGLDQRLEKLEHSSQQTSLRDAVKGLHQGLSCLTDQVGQATVRTGGQVTSLAHNLERLALQLVQTRAEAEAAAQTLQTEIAQTDARLEETRDLTAEALSQALARIDAQGSLQDQYLAEIGQRESGHQMVLAQIEERLARLELPDLGLQERLESIEDSLAALRREMEAPDPHAGLADALGQISLRLEILEQSHADLMAEFRSAPASLPEPGPVAAVAFAALEPEPVVAACEESPIAPAAPDVPAPEFEGLSDGAENNFVQDAFAGHFEMPRDLADALAGQGVTGEQEIFEKARRSVDAAEADPGLGLNGLGWIRPPLRDERARPNYLAILAAVFLLLLAAAAGLMLDQRSGEDNLPRLGSSHTAMPQRPVAAASGPSGGQFQHASPPSAPVKAKTAIAPQTSAAPAPQPSKLAANALLRAADEGNAAAQTIVGLQYLDADEAAKALPWLKKAAEAGQPVAQYRLATLYERGQGVGASPALAAKWYLAAANQGNRKAMHNLAVAYAEGSAGKTDMEEAARWFAKAASLGLADSQFNLAVLYERGSGVPQSLADSYKWYSIAAAQGDAESKMRLSILKSQLSDADRMAAEHAAQNFRPEPMDPLANFAPEPGDIGS